MGWCLGLMTYLQWRSLDGLVRSFRNSCEIRQNNRRVVVAAEGSRRGGFAAAEALHSNSKVCLEWRDPPPPALHHHYHNTQERKGERRCYRVLAARVPTCSWIPNVAEDQKSELSLFCQVCHYKMLGSPLLMTPPPPLSRTPHSHTDTHTHAGELPLWRDLLVWPANHLCINTKIWGMQMSSQVSVHITWTPLLPWK